jgi:hypothetical protein
MGQRLYLVELSDYAHLLQDWHQLLVPAHHNSVLLLNDRVITSAHLQVW